MSHIISEEKRRQHLSFIQKNHIKLSAFARERYQESGRGLLFVSQEPNGHCAIVYVGPEKVGGEAPRMVSRYKPEEEYLVAIVQPNLPIGIYHFKLAASTSSKDEVSEPVFNLFVYVSDGIINRVGAVRHYFSGTDMEKTAFLQSRVKTDLPAAKSYRVPSNYILLTSSGRRSFGIRYEVFLELMLAQKHLGLFEQAFRDLGASKTPLYCVTPIINGVPRIDAVINPRALA
jgi:hypothetical protein